MKFGENLKKLRKSRNLSQEDLAEKVGVSRQSVSKWETSEAYPEMNNILQLCKIFHCKINDLVNDGIIDSNLLDDEIKNNVVKFKMEQQKKVKGLSRGIALIAKLGKILLMIALPVILLAMVAMPYLIQITSVHGNEIMIKSGKYPLTINEVDNHIKITYKNEVIEETYQGLEFSKIREFYQRYTKGEMITYVEIALSVLMVTLIILMIILTHLEKLFKNIEQEQTPFTLENIHHIKKMAYLMIGLIILPNFSEVVMEFILKADFPFGFGFELFDLMEILFLFSMVYIFQYGYEIQLDSKGRMYE